MSLLINFFKPTIGKIALFIVVAGLVWLFGSFSSPASEFKAPFAMFEVRLSSCRKVPEGMFATCGERVLLPTGVVMNLLLYYFFTCIVIFLISKAKSLKSHD